MRVVRESPVETSLIALGALGLYSLLFSRKIKLISDPLVLGVVAHAFGLTAIIVMRVSGDLADEYLVSFLVTELAFICGFFIFCEKNSIIALSEQSDLFQSDKLPIVLAIYWANIIVVSVFSVLFFLKSGIALLDRTSRLETFQELGVVAWFVDVGWVALPVSVVWKAKLRRIGALDYFAIFSCLLFLMTKGGKSDFILLIFVLSVASLHLSLNKLRKIMTVAALVSPLLLLALTAVVLTVWDSDISVMLPAAQIRRNLAA